ncbi:ABC transporter permease [Streptomyces sp. NPDC000134]|uniref:ABC transporter permease n=1 Tax=Streptomyces sp. NPDC000134 TaxID=3364536 RepID=UPI0036D04F48
MRAARLLGCATRFAMVEHARNRLAVALMVVFVPLWVTLARLTVGSEAMRFRLRATGEVLAANGSQLTQITGAMNAITGIIGFMMFAATFSSGSFDQRLVMAGFPRVHLLAAKVVCMSLAAIALVAYATVVLCVFWSPRQPFLLAAALFSTALTYGAIGVALGALLRREVEGMFAIVMLSVTDIVLQNPVQSSSAETGFVSCLPSYGAMQTAVAAGFSDTALPGCLLLPLSWFAVAAAFSLWTFHRRTRVAPRAVTPPVPAAPVATGR